MGRGVLDQPGGHCFLSTLDPFVIPKDFNPEESASPIRAADSSPLKWFGMTRALGVFQLRGDVRKKQVPRLGNHSRDE
jgi:hypothetical protein